MPPRSASFFCILQILHGSNFAMNLETRNRFQKWRFEEGAKLTIAGLESLWMCTCMKSPGRHGEIRGLELMNLPSASARTACKNTDYWWWAGGWLQHVPWTSLSDATCILTTCSFLSGWRSSVTTFMTALSAWSCRCQKDAKRKVQEKWNENLAWTFSMPCALAHATWQGCKKGIYNGITHTQYIYIYMYIYIYKSTIMIMKCPWLLDVSGGGTEASAGCCNGSSTWGRRAATTSWRGSVATPGGSWRR